VAAENRDEPAALPPTASEPNGSEPHVDQALEALREILFSRYRRQIADLEQQLADLEQRTTDEDALIGMITPVLGDVVRRKVRDARDEMVEALYPIIGQIVVRAVAEASREFARSVDRQLRTGFSLRAVGRRMRARLSGVSGTAVILRDAMPFSMAEIFFIHRTSGLLIQHISRDPMVVDDSDLIGGMLTAIRDFSADAFGRSQSGQLDEIQYGDRRILIESAQHAYLAVVVDGIEPAGFRAAMRERIIEIDSAHAQHLREYNGDPRPLASTVESLRSLMIAAQPQRLKPIHKAVLAAITGVSLLCATLACFAGNLAWRAYSAAPPPPFMVVVVAPTPAPTVPPTATNMPTAMSTPTVAPPAPPTPTAAPTSAPVFGVMVGDVFLHTGPADDTARLGPVVGRKEQVELLAVTADWYRIRWVSAGTEVIGWVPAKWVGLRGLIPARMVTPVARP
jgi:hypothetical protein